MLYTKIFELMSNNAHLTIEGLHKIINIKASMNWSISEMLKSEFKNITQVDRPIVITSTLSNPNRLAGFVSGEGCFDIDIDISKSKSTSIGHRVQLRFRIKQHERDLKLMELLKKYLGSWTIYKDPKLPKLELKIVKFSNITKIIIPFFERNLLLGVKQLDYLDWCKVANLISEGSHLTKEGLEQIRIIKSGMNKGRKLTKFLIAW
uniref:LAGLIDADG endonuclease n=1 Tax=Clavaria fumosa TaxID=264083 RepID=A0A7T3PCM8_9AGAR|nr:LAGLIDADG endonuclease [Clavaria fumosa]QPZ51068.1 LAGLIDADG endonuclease [Clavaria fumosa]